jgi:hypothetical protein
MPGWSPVWKPRQGECISGEELAVQMQERPRPIISDMLNITSNSARTPDAGSAYRFQGDGSRSA